MNLIKKIFTGFLLGFLISGQVCATGIRWVEQFDHGIGIGMPSGSKDWSKTHWLKLAYPGATDKVSKLPALIDLSAGRFNNIGQTTAANTVVKNSDGSASLGPGAYTVLNSKSNDLSYVSVWSGGSLPVLSTNSLQATAQYQTRTTSITTTDGESYTLSFYAYVESDGNLTNYRFRHGNSASGDSSSLSLTETRQRYSVTILGRTGGGVVSFGFQDNNPSNWSKVYIDTINVTESNYTLPPVINNTAGTMTVPLNYSNGGGIKYPMSGDPDIDDIQYWDYTGSDLNSTWTPGSGWTSDGDNKYTHSGGGSWQNLDRLFIFDVGKRYEIKFNVLSVTSVGVLSSSTLTGSTGINISAPVDGLYFRGTANNHFARIQTSSTPFDGQIEIVHIREIIPNQKWETCKSNLISAFYGTDGTDAEGHFYIEWTPQYSAGDIDGSVNIIDLDGTGNWLIHDDVNNLIKVTDGTNTATIACSPVAKTKYIIELDYNGGSSQMRLSLDGTPGTAVAFAGSFPIGDRLSFGWLADGLMHVDDVDFKKESDL